MFFKQVHELINDERVKWDRNVAEDKIHEIYKNYLSESANLGLSVPNSITRKIEAKLDKEKNLDTSIFDEAIDYVWNTLIAAEPDDEKKGVCSKGLKGYTLRYLFWNN